MQSIHKACPGLLIEKHVLSTHELKAHSPNPYCYQPQDITSNMLDTESTLDMTLHNPNINMQESIVQLIMFGKWKLIIEKIVQFSL